MQFQWNFAHTLPTRARIYYTRRRCSAVLARRFFGKSNIQNCCPAGLLSMQPPPPLPLQQPLSATTPQLPLCPRAVIYYFTLTRQTFLNSSTKQRHFCTTHSPALLSPLSPLPTQQPLITHRPKWIFTHKWVAPLVCGNCCWKVSAAYEILST